MTFSSVMIDTAFAKSLVPKRQPGAHKWGVGGVLVIAGSPLYTGAAWLASRAAGRAGAGIVLLASGRSVIGALSSSLPEVAHIIIPESDSQSGAKRTLELLDDKIGRVKSVVIGPGLGDDDAASSLLGTLFGFGRTPLKARENIGFGMRGKLLSAPSTEAESEHPPCGPIFGDGTTPVVIDADALNWLATQPEWWLSLPDHKAVLTPHVGELARLLDTDADTILKDPQSHAEQAATAWKQNVVLKIGKTVATDGERTLIAEQESVALATAGSGDVFAGTIGAMLAQGLAPLDAAAVAIYLGTSAAGALTKDFGELGVIAIDLPDAIARATRTLVS